MTTGIPCSNQTIRDRAEAVIESPWARGFSRAMALCIPFFGFFMWNAWQEQKDINRAVQQNQLTLAITAARVESHEGRVSRLERFNDLRTDAGKPPEFTPASTVN